MPKNLFFFYITIASLIIIGFIHQDSASKPSLVVNIYLNPDTANIGQIVNLGVSMRNEAVSTLVRSVELKVPQWNLELGSLKPFELEPNKTFFKNFALTVPDTAIAGKYTIDVLVNTTGGDYEATSGLTVNRIESIPFSGNIPLSILVVIFSGIITYCVMIYIITQKVDRGYVELSLFSVGFGLLNWSIAHSINIVKLMESIQFEPVNIAILFSISAAVGIALGFSVRAFQTIMSIQSAKNKKKKEQSQLQKEGFASTDENIWPDFVDEEWTMVKGILGKKYSLAVRVHLKNSLNDSKYIEGILYDYEDDRPYDLILESKYTVHTSDKELIINILSSLIAKRLNTDKKYRTNILKYLKTIDSRNNAVNPEQISTTLKGILIASPSIDDFTKILEAIDFSIYAYDVINELSGQNMRVTCDYQRAFIPGDNISRVEIIKYESFYAISFEKDRVVPKVYDLLDMPFLKDMTVD